MFFAREGAKIVTDNKFHIEEPNVVLEACKRYKNKNDWLHQFINECCKLGEEEKVGSGVFYQKHRNEFVRPSNDFKAAMELAWFKTTHPHSRESSEMTSLTSPYPDPMYFVHNSKVPMRPTTEIRWAEIFKKLVFVDQLLLLIIYVVLF